MGSRRKISLRLQSLDFPLTGRRVIPTLKQGAEQFAPTYRFRSIESNAQPVSTEQQTVEETLRKHEGPIYIRTGGVDINHIRNDLKQVLLNNIHGVVIKQFSFTPGATLHQRAASSEYENVTDCSADGTYDEETLHYIAERVAQTEESDELERLWLVAQIEAYLAE